MRETLSFRSRPEELHGIRQFVRERATSASWSSRDVEELVQAVSEACANSMIHSGSNQLTLTWNRETERVEVQIQDEGVFGSPSGPETGRSGGHGLSIMRAFVDEVDIRKGTEDRPGTTVRLVKSATEGR